MYISYINKNRENLIAFVMPKAFGTHENYALPGQPFDEIFLK